VLAATVGVLAAPKDELFNSGYQYRQFNQWKDNNT